uniref:Lin1244/Lin1753-like N-terminal domain-containing protein n=1 Tax=viral metagenome TaxID=1070528 RepID=A0A6H1ZTE8_9ZZZZ
MPRPRKAKVDYFPHLVKHGKTMYVLEKKYGNDGYAFWFKLLELLGDTENHFIDCNDPSQWEFLIAKSHVDTEMAENILQTLQTLDAIDRDLWDKKVIWSENFVFNLSTVYNRREVSAYNKPEVWDFCKHKHNWDGDSVNINPKDGNINPQREEKERKGKERKGDTITQNFEIFWKAYPKKKAKGKAEGAWKKIKDPENTLTIILKAIDWQKNSPDWLRDGGQFIPYPASYLNGKCWEDEEIKQADSWDNNLGEIR